jgi:hypothetical protein
MAKKKPDFSIDNRGSICLLDLISQEAQDWGEEHIGEHQTWCGKIVVEPRYVDNLVSGLLAEGFTC